MDGWDIALLVAAGYFAVIALVRMMLARRNRLLVDFRNRLVEERSRRKRKSRPATNKGRAA